MIRVLVFDGPRATKRFSLLYTALSTGGADSDGKSERTPAAIRKEARLQDAFDTISRPATITSPNEPDRTLMNGPDPHRLVLPQEDFELLQRYTERTPWSPRISRDVCDLWDWLTAAEKKDA